MSSSCTSPRSVRSPSPSVLKCNKNVTDIFKKHGFSNWVKIKETRYGQIWRVASNESGKVKTSIIKITEQHINHLMDKTCKINQDILTEQNILKYLCNDTQCPQSIIKFEKFFQTDTDYYLITEDVNGSSLLDFIKKSHNLIKCGKIRISHWKKVSKTILSQMIQCIEYIHNKNICHFNISLDSFLINDAEIIINKFISKQYTKEVITFVLDSIQIKLSEFGLSQMFSNRKCLSNKYCGQTMYVSPEVINKKHRFKAKMNDIWCIGVCIFFMSTGLAPFRIANKRDDTFVNITQDGKLMDLLIAWNIVRYVDENLFDLIDSIFQYEEYRIDLQSIKQHCWLKNI